MQTHYCANPKCDLHRLVETPRIDAVVYLAGDPKHPTFHHYDDVFMKVMLSPQHTIGVELTMSIDNQPELKLYGQPVLRRYRFKVTVNGIEIRDHWCHRCNVIHDSITGNFSDWLHAGIRVCANPLCHWHGRNAIHPTVEFYQFHKVSTPYKLKEQPMATLYQITRHPLYPLGVEFGEPAYICNECYEVAAMLGVTD